MSDLQRLSIMLCTLFAPDFPGQECMAQRETASPIPTSLSLLTNTPNTASHTPIDLSRGAR